MVVLQAIRLDAYERFQYRIDVENEPPFLTTDPEAAVAKLLELGVMNPGRLVTHVREWGTIEIPLPR